MGNWLRQSTAVTTKFGPFLDKTDGVTEETGLTIVQANIRLSKNGGNIAQSNNVAGATHDELGYYGVPLDATDTNTLGTLRVIVHDVATHLPVWQDFEVISAVVYDAIIAGSDNLQVDLVQIGGSTQSGTDLKDFADAGYDPATNKVEGVKLADVVTALTGHTAQTGDNYSILNHAVSGILEIFRKTSNMAGFIRHGQGMSWPLGIPFYWDPVSGNDSNDGLTLENPKLTFAATLALCTAYHHDAVVVLNTTGAALTIDLKVDVNVAKVHLVGDGNTTIKPTSIGAATVILSAVGCHIEGLNVETHTVGNENSIEITADECQAHEFKVPYSRASAIVINGANDCILHNFVLRTPGVGGNGHGVVITGNSTGNRVHDFDINGAAGDGINLNGGGVTENIISSGDGDSVIHECLEWGIREIGGADDNEILGPNLLVEDNASGNFSLGGSTTNRNTAQFADETTLNTHDTDIKAGQSTIAGRLPAALVSGRMDSNISAINDSNAAAVRLALSAGTIVVGVAVAGTLSLTEMTTNLTETTDDHYIGRVIIWTSGNLLDQASNITDYNGTSKMLTFTDVTDIPAADDTFIIV